MSAAAIISHLLLQFDFSSAQLRAETASIAVGFIAVAVALAAFVVFLIRRNRGDRTLLWFALFAFVYGVRILLGTAVFRGAFDLRRDVAASTVALITFWIQVPGVLFGTAIIDAWHDRIARALLVVACAEAVAGTMVTIAGTALPTMFTINNLLVVFVMLPGYVWLFSKNSEARGMVALKTAFAIFMAAVLFDNLAGVGVLPTSVRVETAGFIVLLAGMGWTAAQRTISGQQRLVAIERELEIARTIQKSILPETVPEVTGLDIAVRYEPMTAVAGDFYDFVRLEDRRLGVLVADVSGHGVPAALIAAMLKMAFATHAADATDPARLLTSLNAAMCGRFSAHFVTAVYALIDLSNGTVTYSGAAHPPILMRRGEHAQELAENGLMLGAFPFAQYTNASASIVGGDSLLLYTDGLVEAANQRQEEFGAERLKATLDGGSATQIISRLFDGVAAWSGLKNGRAQEDDLTAVAITVR